MSKVWEHRHKSGSAWREVLLRLGVWYQDERGANMFVVLALCFGLVLLTPVFIDFGSLHYSRRTSQTGVDAGAHAAAVQYAQRHYLGGLTYTLPTPFEGMCGEPPPAITARYLATVVWPRFYAYTGRAPAYLYAARHRVIVDRYRQYPQSPSGYGKVVAGVWIPALGFFVHGRRPVYASYQYLYGVPFLAPARATAEAYVSSYTILPRPPCGKVPRFAMEYRWKVRLIGSVE